MSSATQSTEFVVDTIGLVLYLERRRVSTKLQSIFTAAEYGEAGIIVPAMMFAEVLYLSEKGRITVNLDQVDEFLKRHPTSKQYPMTLDVIQVAGEITDIPELHDRLIAATARHLGLDLITNDGVIQKSAFVRTVW